jgi:hypothetical protein
MVERVRCAEGAGNPRRPRLPLPNLLVFEGIWLEGTARQAARQ